MQGWRGRVRTVTAAAVTAVVTVLPALLAGCASSSSEPPTAGAGDCPSPGVSGDKIKIGLIYPDSGSNYIENFRAVRSAVEARVGLQNANGGIHGRQVEIVWRDDRSDPTAFASAARDLVDNERVFGLIAQSIVSGPSLQWLDEAGIPATGAGVDPTWVQHRNLFSFSSLFNSSGAADTFGRYVRANQGTKAYLVIDSKAPGASGLIAHFPPSLESQGVAVVGTTDYGSDAATPAKVVNALRQSGADTLVGLLDSETFIQIYAAARAAGVRLNVALTTTSYGKALLDQRGPDVAGISAISGYAPFDGNSPVIQTYHSAMTTYAPELAEPDQEAALLSYVAADELLHGIDLAGACPTRDAFITKMRQVTDYDADGLIAPSNLSTPTAPATCFTFIKADAAGAKFEPVPPAVDGVKGFWCGKAL